jgi:hypothetical protein
MHCIFLDIITPNDHECAKGSSWDMGPWEAVPMLDKNTPRRQDALQNIFLL